MPIKPAPAAEVDAIPEVTTRSGRRLRVPKGLADYLPQPFRGIPAHIRRPPREQRVFRPYHGQVDTLQGQQDPTAEFAALVVENVPAIDTAELSIKTEPNEFDDFDANHLQNFSAARELKRLDKHSQTSDAFDIPTTATHGLSVAPGGFGTRRLHRVGFIDVDDYKPFGFLNPDEVLQGVHLIPAFAHGRTSSLLPPSVAQRSDDNDEDWQFYYVNMFIDRDMFMRYLGGAVGHKGASVSPTEDNDGMDIDDDESDDDNQSVDSRVQDEDEDEDEDEHEDEDEGPIAQEKDDYGYDISDDEEDEEGAGDEGIDHEEEDLGPEDGEDGEEDEYGDEGYAPL
ncbi:hypothetical protein BKA93DRAFT_822458 [Sparassis latifolia]